MSWGFNWFITVVLLLIAFPAPRGWYGSVKLLYWRWRFERKQRRMGVR